MDTAAAWQRLFEQWPEHKTRVGIVVANSQEPISFTDFMVTPGILALERERPDTQGARKVLISFSAITAVKLVDTGSFNELKQLGFC